MENFDFGLNFEETQRWPLLTEVDPVFGASWRILGLLLQFYLVGREEGNDSKDSTLPSGRIG